MNMANNLERVFSWSFGSSKISAWGHTVHTFCLGCTHIIMFAVKFALKSLAVGREGKRRHKTHPIENVPCLLDPFASFKVPRKPD